MAELKRSEPTQLALFNSIFVSTTLDELYMNASMRLATVKSPPIIAHRDTKNDDQDLELMYRKKEVKGF